MQGLLHFSESWVDPLPRLKRSVGLVLAVLLTEVFFIWVGGRETGVSPIYLLAAARVTDLVILALGGAVPLKPAFSAVAVKEGLGLTAVLMATGVLFLIAWRVILGTPFLRVDPGVYSLTWVQGLPFFLNACLISPVVEEMFFRGILYRGLRQLLGIWVSVLLISVLFSIIHLHFSGQALVPFLGSLIFSLGYEKNKAISTPVLLHIGGNVLIFGSGAVPYL